MATIRRKPVTAKSKSKAKTKDEKRVNVNADPLADLGLDAATTAQPKQAAATSVSSKTTMEQPAKSKPDEDPKGDEVEVGDIEFGFTEDIPVARRKVEGSKYKFDQLPAPSKDENTGKQRIAFFKVLLQPGVDQDKLRRSVQSATTQANKQEGRYFISRSLVEDGKFKGMIVYRTDDRPKK